ncbi:MAG TPA: hypothetical protein VK786_05490, partial [bacterium]|nr:hypothetical protein [bacterium]
MNGNWVVQNVHDIGNQNPLPTTSIPIADFNPPGTPNYYAYVISNTTAALVGGDWLIAITCQGGEVTYMSSSDTSLTEYDDMQGSSPPQMEDGVNWYDSTWPDTLNQFSDPIVYGAIDWFNPSSLTDPETGGPVPVLSYSSNGDQCGLPGCVSQVLYYRQAVVIPTPPPTPTPYPTVCGATPAFVQSSILNSASTGGSGCLAS